MLQTNLIIEEKGSIQTTIGEVPTSEVGEVAEEEAGLPRTHGRSVVSVTTLQ
jgi:hypothetical protein